VLGLTVSVHLYCGGRVSVGFAGSVASARELLLCAHKCGVDFIDVEARLTDAVFALKALRTRTCSASRQAKARSCWNASDVVIAVLVLRCCFCDVQVDYFKTLPFSTRPDPRLDSQ
jgi:hypothetical protein